MPSLRPLLVGAGVALFLLAGVPPGGSGAPSDWSLVRHGAVADTILPPPTTVPDSLVGRILPDTLLTPSLRDLRASLFPDAREPLEDLPDLDDEPEVVIRNLAMIPRPVPEAWETGVWEWDREELKNVRALTLVELLEEIPGVLALRGGDYGQPTTVTAFGLDPGRVRIFQDGVEMPPLDGGVVDLSRVGLVGLDRVRVERRPGELRVDLLGLQFWDPRPYTLLEVGTGDLNTNVFRGTFAHPTVLGGNVIVALDRVDTEGPFREELGASFGAYIRYTLFRGDRGGVSWDLRRMSSRRPTEVWQPRDVHRTDWSLRGRFEVSEGVLADAFYQSSSLSLDADLAPEAPGRDLINTDGRSQLGLTLSTERGSWWGEGSLRRQGGDGWPSSTQRLSGGGRFPELGGASFSVEREAWDDESGTDLHLRAWSRAVRGISLFAEMEDGRRGVRHHVPPARDEEENGNQMDGPDEEEEDDEEPRVPSFTERSGLRVGAEFRRGDLFLGAAALAVSADSLHPMGLPTDRGGPVVPGGDRTGIEVSGQIPLSPILPGLFLEGDVQFWNGPDEETGPWSYLPATTYHSRLRFQNVFLESENLEVWADVGVRGRDPMFVPAPEGAGAGTLTEVPFYQSWFARLQVRVVTVRVFVVWENFTVRDDNQDFPGRLLPPTRALYGVRWTMWN